MIGSKWYILVNYVLLLGIPFELIIDGFSLHNVKNRLKRKYLLKVIIILLCKIEEYL
jgi:hypothetical protein